MFRLHSEMITPTLCLALVVSACGGSGGEATTPPTGPGSATAAGGAEAPPPSGEHGSTRAATADDTLGRPLENPERFYGLYADPETPDRSWFVTEAKRPPEAEQAPEVPPGHLMLGAAFGDVAPWTLRTLSATEFEQAWVGGSGPEPVRVEFELAPAGNAVAMRFTSGQLASEGRLERTGDLPPEWR